MKKYSVNPNAENVLNGVAATILVIGWIFAVVGIIAGIAAAIDQGEWFYALAGFLGGGLILLMFYIVWAELKVIINISRSLYNIQDELESLKADRHEAVE